MRMQERIKILDYLNKLKSILIELCNINVKVEDEDVALIMSIYLPNFFENIVQLFIIRKDTMKLEEVRLGFIVGIAP